MSVMDIKRKCHKTKITDRSVFLNRTYSDFCSLGLSSFVEIDTVHFSRESNKTLLTFLFTQKNISCFSTQSIYPRFNKTYL